MTLIEMMTSLAVMMLIIQGAILIVIASARSSRNALERTDSQRGARSALGILVSEIESAGAGLPARLAIRRFNPDVVGSADTLGESGACPGSPELEVATLDYSREWAVQSTGGSSITFAALSSNPASKNPIGLADQEIAAGEWVFFYQNSTVDLVGNNHGHGMLRVGTRRQVNSTTLDIDETAFGVQAGLSLDQGFATGHDKVLLRARVSKFGIIGLNPDKKQVLPNYLYWLASTSPTRKSPVVENLKSLIFRFQLDLDGDGVPDDADGDGAPDLSDTLSNDEIPKVIAIQVVMDICTRAPIKDPVTALYNCDSEVFSQVIPTHNINTHSDQYVFVDNKALTP